MNFKRIIKPVMVLAVCLLTAPFISFGQTDPDDPGGDPDEPVDIPIDGGASALVGTAIVFAMRQFKKAKSDEGSSVKP